MLPFKYPRTSQPQGSGATVDRSSALGSLDWRLLFSGGGSVSGSANPNWPTPIGTGSVIGVGKAGRSIGTNREKQGDYWSWGNNPQLKLDSMCGFCVFDRSAASTVVSSLFDTGITSSNNFGLGININADGSLALNYQDHANLVTTNSTPYKPGINVVAWRWDNAAGTGAIIYNGQKFTGATSPKAFTHGVASSCGYYSSPNGYGNTACGIYMLGISSNGDIDDSTLSRIHNQYLSLFKPQSRILWIPGTVSGGGVATVIPIGQQATGSVGTLVATGAAKGLPAGVSASSAVGTPVATGGTTIPATVLPAGVSAASAVGTPSANGAAKASPTGVLAAAAVGALSAKGAALGTPLGVSATASVGTPTAIAGANIPATALPAGVAANAAVGTPTANGAARASPIGVQATSSVGTPVVVAGSSAIAMPLGVQATGSIGALIATGAAWTVPVGVLASSSVGTPIAYTAGLAYWPTPAQVLAGVQYGPAGADYTGTLTGGSGPSAADIAAAVWGYTQ